MPQEELDQIENPEMRTMASRYSEDPIAHIQKDRNQKIFAETIYALRIFRNYVRERWEVSEPEHEPITDSIACGYQT